MKLLSVTGLMFIQDRSFLWIHIVDHIMIQFLGCFQITVGRKTNTTVTSPTNHNRSKKRDEPIRIPSSYLRSFLKARETLRAQDAIGFGLGFTSHWLKNWREIFQPITKCSNRNQVITFDSHLKTALSSIGGQGDKK